MMQGKFLKADAFDMIDNTLNRSYHGKVFLFEKCVIYTEQIAEGKLEYRGHYECGQFKIREFDGKQKFVLYLDIIGCNEVEFSKETQQLEEWYTKLNEMIEEGLFRWSTVQFNFKTFFYYFR
jgi:hypothetical protein